MSRCPGYDSAAVKPMDEEAHIRLTAEGSASQYHRAPAHPHLFCGCGTEAVDCHPGRCCRDGEWGQCVNCGRAGDPPPSPDEAELTDPLFPMEASAWTEHADQGAAERLREARFASWFHDDYETNEPDGCRAAALVAPPAGSDPRHTTPPDVSGYIGKHERGPR